MRRHYIIPIFVPHFGCPHDCIFCNQKKITGLSTNIEPKDVERIIEEHIKTFKEDSFIELAFYGGSFTAIDISTQSKLLEIPFKYKRKGIIHEIRLSTRPDAIDTEILDNLKRYEVDTIELGVQSLDEQVLNASLRGHTVKDVYNSVQLIKSYGFKLGLQMMIGLPKDSFKSDIRTAEKFIELEPDCVRIYPTLVIKETYLEDMYLNESYLPLDLEEAVETSSILLMMFVSSNINVIRVGLQPTENMQFGKDIIAGPFHPAFRQLAEANIYRKLIDFYLRDKEMIYEDKIMTLESNSKNISNIVGQKACNTNYLIKNYGFKKMKVFSKDMDVNNITIKIDDYEDKINIKDLINLYIEKS